MLKHLNELNSRILANNRKFRESKRTLDVLRSKTIRLCEYGSIDTLYATHMESISKYTDIMNAALDENIILQQERDELYAKLKDAGYVYTENYARRCFEYVKQEVIDEQYVKFETFLPVTLSDGTGKAYIDTVWWNDVHNKYRYPNTFPYEVCYIPNMVLSARISKISANIDALEKDAKFEVRYPKFFGIRIRKFW